MIPVEHKHQVIVRDYLAEWIAWWLAEGDLDGGTPQLPELMRPSDEEKVRRAAYVLSGCARRVAARDTDAEAVGS